MNEVRLLGRLTKDPDVRYTQNGKAITKFSIAVDDGKDRQPNFIPIVCWNKLAEACGNNLIKGQKVLVSGKINVRNYEKDGVNKMMLQVNALKVIFLEKPKNAEELEFLK